MLGRRRPDAHIGDIPDDPQPGDYWKVLVAPESLTATSNLTKTAWAVIGPEAGFPVSILTLHTVREEDDGTISVRPGDGSSNSILLTGAHGKTWHGYIEHGDWRA